MCCKRSSCGVRPVHEMQDQFMRCKTSSCDVCETSSCDVKRVHVVQDEFIRCRTSSCDVRRVRAVQDKFMWCKTSSCDARRMKRDRSRRHSPSSCWRMLRNWNDMNHAANTFSSYQTSGTRQIYRRPSLLIAINTTEGLTRRVNYRTTLMAARPESTDSCNH